MKKVQKILLILAIIFSVFSFIVLFLPYLIDLEKFKPKIQTLVSEKLNAHVDFSSARLSLFGGLGLRLKDVSLTNTSAPFAGQKVFSAEKLEIQFEIFPIFAHKLIGTVYLDNPDVNIIKIGKQNNLSEITKPEPLDAPNNKPKNDSDKKGYTLVLNEFDVTNAHLIFKDLTSKGAPTIVDIRDINIDMTRKGNILDIDKLTMKLFSGALKSQMKINLDDPQIAYSGDCSLKDFSLGDVYQSFGGRTKPQPINGKANVDFTFNGRGTTEEVYSKSLNADGTFKINEGAILLDTTLPVIIDQLGRFLLTLSIPGLKLGITPGDVKKAGSIAEQKISLDSIQGKFTIRNGSLILKNDLPMVQGLLNLDTTIGIFTSRILGTATFLATEAFTKSLIETNPNFSYLLNKDGRFYLKIFLSGNVSSPNIALDTSDLTRNILLHTASSILNSPQDLKNGLQNTLKLPFTKGAPAK